MKDNAVSSDLSGKRILLVIGGGIAAFKSLDLIRRLRERGASVRAVLTKAGAEFVTPLSVSALTEDKVYTDLFSLTDEAEMGHIQLSRQADLVVVAPATADLIAKMAHGHANDLASTVLMATDKRVLIAPAMNVRMWDHKATQRNLTTLQGDGVLVAGPNEGAMACGEFGPGRMAEPLEIVTAIERAFAVSQPLSGKRAIVTSGPTHEPIDPVRFIGNRSSGKQGHAIAAALAGQGADVTLVTGPVALPDPAGVETVHVETAREMLAAVEAALPADIAVCAAAVADWRVADEADQKLKKEEGKTLPTLNLTENPDILKAVSRHPSKRPDLVVGFAAETEKVEEHAAAKRSRKGCDWILANDVSPQTGTFGGDRNAVTLISDTGSVPWPAADKADIANRLAAEISAHFAPGTDKSPLEVAE
ncbi:MAG: bifunctional phosphopantothenoylcysteine decarboxylase/phosphopantothenate--cysteine ligase CoaBC [Alphaproteobacteria bacterium]|nr:bifunctional phosphopantothenoylcysteine decarboxylase/phosphopantothenate--cysteine ligase CoaBC [Alphaproteobacteria bacterium]